MVQTGDDPHRCGSARSFGPDYLRNQGAVLRAIGRGPIPMTIIRGASAWEAKFTDRAHRPPHQLRPLAFLSDLEKSTEGLTNRRKAAHKKFEDRWRPTAHELGGRRGAELAAHPRRKYNLRAMRNWPHLPRNKQTQLNPCAIPPCLSQVQDLVPVKGVEVRVLSSALCSERVYVDEA